MDNNNNNEEEYMIKDENGEMMTLGEYRGKAMETVAMLAAHAGEIKTTDRVPHERETTIIRREMAKKEKEEGFTFNDLEELFGLSYERFKEAEADETGAFRFELWELVRYAAALMPDYESGLYLVKAGGRVLRTGYLEEQIYNTILEEVCPENISTREKIKMVTDWIERNLAIPTLHKPAPTEEEHE